MFFVFTECDGEETCFRAITTSFIIPLVCVCVWGGGGGGGVGWGGGSE